MLRYLDECASEREISDRDAHPMVKADSGNSDDLSQEIGECLADQGAPLVLYPFKLPLDLDPWAKCFSDTFWRHLISH